MPFGYAVYFTERARNRVVRWEPDTGIVDVVAGEPAQNEPDQFLKSPYGLAFDQGGSLLIADKLHHRVCRVRQGRLEAMALNDVHDTRARRPNSSPGYDPSLKCPTGLFTEESGTVLCTFADDHTIYRIHPQGELELVLGIPPNRNYLHDRLRESVPASEVTEVPLGAPTGIVKRQNGEILFIERIHQTVRSYRPRRQLTCVFPYAAYGTFSRESAAPEQSSIRNYHPAFPGALALDPDDVLHVTEVAHGCVLRVKDGEVSKVVEIQRHPERPDLGVAAMAFGPDGTAWIMNSARGAIEAYAPTTNGPWKDIGSSLTQVRGDNLVLPPAGSGMVTGN